MPYSTDVILFEQEMKYLLAVPSSVMIKSSEKSSIATTTYSDEEAVALSYASLFDNIWIRQELKQRK